MTQKKPKQASVQNSENSPGVELEKVVARIQQMMDPNSSVTHNEKLVDRVGNTRQCDVVIRGQFGARPILGIMECKDHSRKKGPDAVEAFAKKTENLGANLRIMVSKKGFTPQALELAKHENIGCLSLLPTDPGQVGFSIGDMWYGVIRKWTNIRLTIHFETAPAPLGTFNSDTVMWDGKPVGNWFVKELFTRHSDETQEGNYTLPCKFKYPRNIEIDGKEYSVIGIDATATLIYQKKKQWVNWSGDAFYDWHTSKITIPAKGSVVGSTIATDLSTWSDYDGEIPQPGEPISGILQMVVYDIQKWDDGKNNEVPDLENL